MSWIGDFKLGNTFDTKFTTRQISGAPSTLSSSPVISNYVGNNTTELTAGITLTVDFDSRTGLNNIRVVATSGNGYATATDNQLVITTGTVNSVSVVGEVVAEYSIENRRADVQFWNGTQVATPATAGIPDVNVKNINNVAAATPGASGGILISGSNSGTTTLAALTVTGTFTVSDGIVVARSSGNSHAVTFTGTGTGDGLKLLGGATGHAFELVGGGTSGDGLKVTTTSGHGFNIAATGTSMHGITATGGNAGTSDGIKAVAGTGGVDLRAAITGNVTGNLSGSVGSVTGAVGSVTGAVGSVTGAVGSVTGNVGGNVVGSVASVTGNVGGNVVGSVASVTARVTANTDQLAGQTVTAAAGVTFPASVASPTNITAGIITTVTNLTNAPTVGDFTAAMKTSVENAAWDATMASHVTAGSTGAALNAAGGAGDPWITALPGAYAAGSAGYILGNNLNAKVGDVKLQTDKLTFTVPNKLDVNILYVNGTAVTGSGTAGSPWGP